MKDKLIIFGLAMMIFSLRFQIRGEEIHLIISSIVFYSGWMCVVLGISRKD